MPTFNYMLPNELSFDPVPEHILKNIFGHQLLRFGSQNAHGISPLPYILKPHFLSSCAMLILSLALLLAKKCILFL